MSKSFIFSIPSSVRRKVLLLIVISLSPACVCIIVIISSIFLVLSGRVNIVWLYGDVSDISSVEVSSFFASVSGVSH
jgi:hypothetical protein